MAMMMTGRVLLVCVLCVLWCGAGGGCAAGEDAEDDGSVRGGKGLSINPENVISAPGALGAPKPHAGVGQEEPLTPKEVPPQTTEEIPEDDAEDEGENSSEEENNSGRINDSTKRIRVEEKKETPAKESLPVKDSHSPQVQEGLKEKDNTEPKTRKEKKKEEGPPPPVSTAQPTTLATTQTPEVKLPGRKTPHVAPEGDASQKGLNDAQTLTHQKHENSSSQTETTAEPPEDPSEGIVAEQQGQATATENLTENAPATNQEETTASSNSTSSGDEARSTADENTANAQRPNPNESHDDLEGSDTHPAPTAGEAAPQTGGTITTANTTDTATPGDSDSSTAVSHTTSPLLLLLFVACAAAAAVVAA
ncbi:Mucin-associated surface protein (MASP) [Trypanosoma cruzi]|uniref:Mucin-associated surface protein (MASP), putative n=2 Tax=Trypanosoma cruzi TaxID=5693 RepID=Q4E223_TRYCC|nr:mucin-associated surface protein (MASP), putative [Trypanosoma cruzi]EAN98818.1 mucin-associated surface protein (MASP), putative [Trypanosoma cruzi]PWV14047.1 Mucin-associated surface protein (MASP) [Trypanosoma cruzi]|eukprot:XP_820669.1 mucin-associated surface protein (MASP) [Trypanosoma cruzi strain CL Brener]